METKKFGFELLIDTNVNLMDPESCILDCNKGEKLIIELNNHICLGEYELARTFFKQIIEIVPTYIEYFYNIIFLRGIPDKWLLSNQIRTSANYIWILYQDYKNELLLIDKCPKISIPIHFLKSNEFDLLITNAFYNSYENLDNFEMSLDFLKDLRNIYNFFSCLHHKCNFFLPKLRILSPDVNQRGLYLTIHECLYEYKESSIFDLTKPNSFMENLKNFILTQPIISKHVIEKILSNCGDLSSREDVIKIEEIFHVIYVNLIMFFLYCKDYQQCYEYLKYIHYNENIELCRGYIQLLFSVIVMISHNHFKNEPDDPKEVLNFVVFCITNFKNVNYKSPYMSNFKNLPYFNSNSQNSNSEYSSSSSSSNESAIKVSQTQDHEKYFLKHKIYEALLANSNGQLLTKLHAVTNLFIDYQSKKKEIPLFFLNYSKNLEKTQILQDLSYEQLMSLIFSYSKYHEIDSDINFLWLKANKNIFWNEYLNFLRVYQEHCLGFVLKQAISYVEVRKFDTAVTLLHPLNNLKLLLILFVWNKFENDIDSRKEILEIFWESYLKYQESYAYRSYTFVPYFEDIIINLDYIINFSMWIQKKVNGYQKINIDSNKIYSDLLQYSIPYVMKNYLVDFDFKQMVAYFIERFPKSNQKLQKNHFHSSMIIFSFFFYHLILKKIEDHFTNMSDSNDNPLFTEQEKEEMSNILQKIILFPYRLNIMGDIFNLIFIRIKDFLDAREKEADQATQMPSHHSQFSYHKKIFIEIVRFLKMVMKPFDNFDYKNLTKIFSSEYLDNDICEMIRGVENKEIFMEDLRYIDTDYLTELQKDSEVSYTNFVIKKTKNLMQNVDELIFRFNIVDNPWLEIIFENNENNNFLSTILQNCKQYFQVAKKFHMWDISKEIISFFNLPDSVYYQNQVDELNYFSQLKRDLTSKVIEDGDLNIDTLIDKEYVKALYLTKNRINTSDFATVSTDVLNFEFFKILFDLSLSENISAYKSTVLMDAAVYYLENSTEKDKVIFKDIIEKYKTLIDPNISRDQREECLSKMIVSTKNLGVVPMSSGNTDKFKHHLAILSIQRLALQALMDKVNQPDAITMSHEDLKKYFSEAFKTLSEYEQYTHSKNQEDTNTKSTKTQHNYLKMFLQYLISIGDIYYEARARYKTKGSNYLKLLKKYPKEIIAKLFLKYNSESEALQVAKMTKTDLISVILEFTDYHKKSIINYNDFNNCFNEIVNALENNSIILCSSENRILKNFENLLEKEEWVKGSEKTFPLTMRILEFVYNLPYEKVESSEEYSQFVPLCVSLYRIDFDSLSDEEQVTFWTLLLEKYMNVKIFNNYIKIIFTKFYLYKTFYKKNKKFKHLYEMIYQSTGNNNNNNTTTTKNQNTIEKFTMYKKMHEKVTDEAELSKMLPKTFSFIPTTNEYVQKLNTSMEKYLSRKLENKSNDYYSKYNTTDDNNFISTSTLNIKFPDIQNPSYKKNITFYENLCRGLLSHKQYDLALEIADNYLDDTKSEVIQILINEIVTTTNDEEKLFKLLIRMKDKKKIFLYTKKNLYVWKPETTLTILRLIKDEHMDISKDEISNMIKKLKVFYAIIKRDILPNRTLQKLEDDCVKDITKILDELMTKNSHDLCYKLLKVYNKFDEFKNTVKFSEIKLLLSTNDICNKILALEKLSEVNENKINFCTLLIKELSNYQNKLLIINYLLVNYKYELDEEISKNLENKKTAIKVFFLIPQILRENIAHLIDYPELIIETLLINRRFDIIKNIFHYFPKLQKDTLITFYGEKAMSFVKIDSQYPRGEIECRPPPGACDELVIFTVDNKEDLRKNYIFKTAPDFDLFVKFMDICKDIKIISNVCFEVSNNCSKYLLEKNPTQPKILFINFIAKVLKYLENRLERYDNESFLQLNSTSSNISIECNTYLYADSKSSAAAEKNEETDEAQLMSTIKKKLNIYEKLTELFKEFIYHGIDDLVNLELNKFYEEEIYKVEVRNKLIGNDYLNLAVKYCEELNIDSTLVDREIGLFFLKNRNFQSARKEFEKILTSNTSQKCSLSSSGNATLRKEEHYEVVNQIIKILQGSFNLKIEELEKIHRYLMIRLSCSVIPNEQSTLNMLERHRKLTLNKIKANSLKSNGSTTQLSQSCCNNNNNNSYNCMNPINLKKYIDIILLDEYLKNEKNVIIHETLFYVKTYGTPTQLLNFYVDNDMLDEALAYIINYRVSIDVFIEEVVKKCYEKRRMGSLRISLKKAFESNKYAHDLVKQLINFLNAESAHEDLIQLYELMNDYLEAALESIQIIKKTNDIEVKMIYYTKAAKNLREYLNMNTGTIIHIYDLYEDRTSNNSMNRIVERSSLQRVLKLLMFQIEVMKIKREIKYTLITDDEEDRYRIVEEIIILNDALALEMIKEYNLKISDIFMRATREFIKNKNYTDFENLLNIVTKWQHAGILKLFSENCDGLWNNILIQAISTISIDSEESKLYIKENIIPRLTDDYSRMYALYLIDELQNSLILAYQMKNTVLIQEIKNRAINDNITSLLEFIENMNL